MHVIKLNIFKSNNFEEDSNRIQVEMISETYLKLKGGLKKETKITEAYC